MELNFRQAKGGCTEIFLDFGLFEFLAVVGLAALSRRIFSKRLLGIVFLVASLAAPVALAVMAAGPIQRWIAIGCMATALVNASAIAAVLQRGKIPQLRFSLQASDRDELSRSVETKTNP